jgi:hypothetical protein
MNAKEELTKLLMESYDKGVEDAMQAALEGMQKAVLLEREACAKVCDDINAKYKWPDDVAERVASQWCADAIRARGETK